MSQFRTKREAEMKATECEEAARAYEGYAVSAGWGPTSRRAFAVEAEWYRTEAARIRALLPSLPDGEGD